MRKKAPARAKWAHIGRVKKFKKFKKFKKAQTGKKKRLGSKRTLNWKVSKSVQMKSNPTGEAEDFS